MTAIVSSVGVSIDGEDIPRHVTHLRRVPGLALDKKVEPPARPREEVDMPGNASDSDSEEEPLGPAPPAVEAAGGDGSVRRPPSSRQKEPPSRWIDVYNDYY